MSVVTRFAPSPTGHLHIGGLRTALYCYLLARKEGGKFLLRVEDTDRTRLVEGAEEGLLDMMDAFGITPDESVRNPGDVGPYRQSDRLDIYQKYIQQLIDEDKAYYCFCSPERLEEVRAKQQEAGLTPKYDRHCRNLTPDEVKAHLDAGDSYTVRLKVPDGVIIEFHDYIRGKITVPSADVDDQVLMKSDGFPTYHFASVIDDYLMNVTHIMLGEEWIASGPKKKLIFDALGWEMPQIVYLPTILGKDKKKLSKRQGDVNAEQFLDRGFLKEALINYITLIGWNPKTTEEFFTLTELEDRFTLDGVQRASGIFDPEKLEWMNGQYIAKMPTDEFKSRLEAYLQKNSSEFYDNVYSQADDSYNTAIIAELQSRFRVLADYPNLTTFFYSEPDVDTDLFLHEKMKITSPADAKGFLESGLQILTQYDGNMSLEALKEFFLGKIQEAELKNGQVLWPIRVALTGEKFSPGALEMMVILGREKSLDRIQKALSKLS